MKSRGSIGSASVSLISKVEAISRLGMVSPRPEELPLYVVMKLHYAITPGHEGRPAGH
jgi:hypothetical protein